MKKVISGIVLTLVLVACAENGVTEKSREYVFPNCTNDFLMVFNERTTFTGSDSTTKVTLEVKSPALNRKFTFERVSSSESGIKYASKDGKYILWEHQEEFTFGTKDSIYCESRNLPKG
ncbi:hypothetical protein D3C71_927380 [compost metagenome]